MERQSRREIVTRAIGLAAVPLLGAKGARAQNPRDAVMQLETVLGQILSWQRPWHLRVHQPSPGIVDSIFLEAPEVQFAFVLHERAAIPPDYQTSRGYRDSLIEDPEQWNLDILAVYSDTHGDHALVVDQHTDRVYYYCVKAIDPQYLLELGLYADIESFVAGWESAQAIMLDGQPVYAGFDAARIRDPLEIRMNGSEPLTPEEAERAYLVAVWAFYFQMRAGTEQLQGARRRTDPADLVEVAAPIVATWDDPIRALRVTTMPGPTFADLDAIAKAAADAYTVAGDIADPMLADAPQPPDWNAFFNALTLAEGLLGQLRQSLDRWELPAQDA